MFSYRLILKQALQITLKYKYLWLFGLFAALTTAGGSWEYNLLTQGFGKNLIDNSYLQLEKILSSLDLVVNFGNGLIVLLTSDIWNILNALTLIMLIGLLFFCFIWLSISSQGALINALKKILKGKQKTQLISYRENITVGHKNFWPVLMMNILIKFLITFSFFIISIPLLLLALKNSTALASVYIILFVLFVPLATGFSLMMKYAISYQIFEDYGFFKSIEKAYKLFKKNWLISLEMAVILFLISFAAALVFALAASIILLPLFITGLAINALWLTFLITYLGIALTIFFGAVLSTFQISAWTGLFFHLKEKGGALAKLERLLRK